MLFSLADTALTPDAAFLDPNLEFPISRVTQLLSINREIWLQKWGVLYISQPWFRASWLFVNGVLHPELGTSIALSRQRAPRMA